MSISLNTRVALSVDLPEHGLKAGDIATVVEFHEAKGRKGYSLEIFNAAGDTIAVIAVEESQIVPLRNDEILHVRHLDKLAA
jgi:3-deoxy-D-manno-octulosonate 8-phosphate phosphatase KdsC-like HAD superfamily phosphatase